MDKFWVVWNPKAGAPKVRHPTRELAKREAEKLAAQNPNDYFFILEALSATRASIVTTEALSESVPF